MLKPKNKVNLSFELPRQEESTNIYYLLNIKQGNDQLKFTEGVPYILTPSIKPEPQINGPLIYGQQPGKQFLYRIAATGKRPMQYRAQRLPTDLQLDELTGIVSGVVKKPGIYSVKVTVSNPLGSDTKTIKFVIGDQIALTPPMGWNS